MALRVRNKSTNVQGTYSLAQTGYPTSTKVRLTTSSARCEDVDGQRETDNLLDITKTTIEGAVLNGRIKRNIGAAIQEASCINYPIVGYHADSRALPPVFNTVARDHTRLLAMTNPSRTEVNVLQFIAELRDLPDMIRHGLMTLRAPIEWDRKTGHIKRLSRLDQITRTRDRLSRWQLVPEGRKVAKDKLSLAKEIASSNLAIQFGWQPMVNDIVEMLTLGEAIEKRRREIERLQSGGGLKRRVVLQRTKEDFTRPLYVISESLFGSINLNVRIERSVRRWGTVRWKPIYTNFATPTDTELWQTLRGITLGATPSLLWELLPWSWLADYFTNVGSYLSSLQNDFGARAHNVCIMTHTQTVTHVPGVSWTYGTQGGLSLKRGEHVYERKQRAVGLVPSISAQMPFLTARQVSILSSIVMTRGNRPSTRIAS